MLQAYALKRLVAGLGSSRQAARQGFALALTLLLQHTPSLSPNAAVDALEAALDISSAKKVCPRADLSVSAPIMLSCWQTVMKPCQQQQWPAWSSQTGLAPLHCFAQQPQ